MAYLLNCSACGEENPVELGMSGETIRCSKCQTIIEVPLLRVLRTMPRTSTDDEKNYWSWRHSITFTGLLIGLIGLAFSIFLAFQVSKPTMVDNENKNIDESLIYSLKLWSQKLKRDQIILPSEMPYVVQLKKEHFDREKARHWQYLAWGVTSMGFLIFCSGFFFPFNTMTGESKTTISHRNHQASQKNQSRTKTNSSQN